MQLPPPWSCSPLARDNKPAGEKPSAPTSSDAAAAITPVDANATSPSADAASAEPTTPGGATAAPASDEDAAALIYAAAADPAKVDAAAVLVPAGTQVKLVERGGGSGKKAFEGVDGLREAFKGGNATKMKLVACSKGCCELEPEFDDDRKLGMQLRKVCFDDKRALTRIEITYEN